MLYSFKHACILLATCSLAAVAAQPDLTYYAKVDAQKSTELFKEADDSSVEIFSTAEPEVYAQNKESFLQKIKSDTELAQELSKTKLPYLTDLRASAAFSYASLAKDDKDIENMLAYLIDKFPVLKDKPFDFLWLESELYEFNSSNTGDICHGFWMHGGKIYLIFRLAEMELTHPTKPEEAALVQASLRTLWDAECKKVLNHFDIDEIDLNKFHTPHWTHSDFLRLMLLEPSPEQYAQILQNMKKLRVIHQDSYRMEQVTHAQLMLDQLGEHCGRYDGEDSYYFYGFDGSIEGVSLRNIVETPFVPFSPQAELDFWMRYLFQISKYEGMSQSFGRWQMKREKEEHSAPPEGARCVESRDSCDSNYP